MIPFCQEGLGTWWHWQHCFPPRHSHSQMKSCGVFNSLQMPQSRKWPESDAVFSPSLFVCLSPVAFPLAFGMEHATWKVQVLLMHLPSFLGTNVGYLSLLDADYDRRPPNKYLAGAVNYTVNFQWIQCVFWDKTGWRSEGPCPHPGSSPEKVNCRYEHPTGEKGLGILTTGSIFIHICVSPWGLLWTVSSHESWCYPNRICLLQLSACQSVTPKERGWCLLGILLSHL